MKYFFLLFLVFQFSFSQNNTIISHGESLICDNKLDEALAHYNKNLKITTNEEDKINIYLGLAEVYKLKLNYNKATEYYAEAYKLIRKNNNIQLKFLYHVKMVEFYRKRTLYENSVEQLKLAELILKKNKVDDILLSKYYNRKAALFTEYFKIQDSTLIYANKSLEIAEKVNDKDNIFYSTLEISGVFEARKDFKNALISLERLLKFSKKNNLVQQHVDAYINYTRILIKSNQFNKALEKSLEALAFSKENNILFGEILFLDNISYVYHKLNNPDKAYEYLKIRLELTDEYYKKEHNKFLFDLEAKYKLKEKENQIKIINLELENQKKTIASNKSEMYIILGLFLCVVLIAFLISYFLRKTRSTNKKLQFLSDQNEFLLSEANHRINNNLQLVVLLISDQMSKLSENDNKEIKKILKKINAIAMLHRHLYQSNDKRTVNGFIYLSDIKDNFSDIFIENNITTNFKIESIELPTDSAMYIGLLVTELCINSIKHAFVNQDNKEINFSLNQKNNVVNFNYSDNGTAISGNVIKPKLIDKLCRQLKIDYEINTEKGFSFTYKKNID